MPNVHDMAEELGLLDTIARAVSFHPAKLCLGVVWNIPVEYTTRLQTSAGMCHYRDGLRITFHPVLAREEHRTDLVETFLHELAHAHAHIVYGQPAHGHGEHWWEMMHQLGQSPRRCHAISDVSRKASLKATKPLEEMGL